MKIPWAFITPFLVAIMAKSVPLYFHIYKNKSKDYDALLYSYNSMCEQNDDNRNNFICREAASKLHNPIISSFYDLLDQTDACIIMSCGDLLLTIINSWSFIALIISFFLFGFLKIKRRINIKKLEKMAIKQLTNIPIDIEDD